MTDARGARFRSLHDEACRFKEKDNNFWRESKNSKNTRAQVEAYMGKTHFCTV
jgi:hypothetical protein